MLASSKRRASLYTLPIVVVIGFGTVAGLAAWQRADVIADLADQVAHGDQTEATAAVRQLAAIPRPPLALLVEAATSDERATAEAAQVSINRMLGQWQRQVEKKQRVSSVAGQVTELASALAARRRDFATADFPWLSGATRKIVKIANQCPAKKTPLVALHCDEIMSVVERRPVGKPMPTPGGDDDLDDWQVEYVADPTGENNLRSAQQARLEEDFATYPTWRMSTDAAASPPTPGDAPSSQTPGPQSGDTGSAVPSANGQQVNREPAEGGRLGQEPPQPQDHAGQPSWSQPIFRIAPPETPKGALEPTPPKALPPITVKAEPANPRAAALETRQLLDRWRDSKDNETQFVEHDLATRGFKKLPKRIVDQYLSEDVNTRLGLVDSILAEPNLDSRPWLALLADDENADVRLAAVTVMATSADKSLVEKAFQVAIRDRDPRIADLAARLRKRRGSALR